LTDERCGLIARRTALIARMRNTASEVRAHDPARRVHLVVAIDRFLVRLLITTSWGAWVLKGGYANQLRHPQDARFTEDVDLRIDADIEDATPMITKAIALDLDGPFTFELASSPRELHGPPGGGLRYAILARLIGQELVRFKVDISSRDAVVGEFERYPSDPIVEQLGMTPGVFPVYPVTQQLAEKLHAYTLPRDVENTRAKDLADMLWLATRYDLSSDALIDACIATFDRRADHTWPPSPSAPPTIWARPYAVLRREMDLAPPTVEDAYLELMAFLKPILAADRRLRWDHETRAWEVPNVSS